MRLTAAGELFVGYIRNRAAELAQVRSKIEDLQGLRRGTVKIVVSQAVASVFLPKHIAHFRSLHPMVDFQVQVGGHRQALNALRTFETELALVFNLAPENDIQAMSEHEQQLCVMMHKDHPLAVKPGKVRLRDCAEYPLVLPSGEMAGRQLLNDYLVRRSLKLRPAIESNSFDFLRGYLYHEQALSFQIAIGVMTDGGQLVSREIEDSGFPKGKLVLASLRGRQLPVIVYAFAEYISQVFANGEPS